MSGFEIILVVLVVILAVSLAAALGLIFWFANGLSHMFDRL